MTYQFNHIIILKLLGTLCQVLEIQMAATIQKKPNRWIVHDDMGAHEFATEKEAKDWAAGNPEKKEEPKAEEVKEEE